MTVPELAPRSGFGGVVIVWALTLAAAISIALFVPRDLQPVWLTATLGITAPVSFAVQLAIGRVHGFIRRVAASVLGSLAIIAIIGLALAVAAMFAL